MSPILAAAYLFLGLSFVAVFLYFALILSTNRTAIKVMKWIVIILLFASIGVVGYYKLL